MHVVAANWTTVPYGTGTRGVGPSWLKTPLHWFLVGKGRNIVGRDEVVRWKDFFPPGISMVGTLLLPVKSIFFLKT